MAGLAMPNWIAPFILAPLLFSSHADVTGVGAFQRLVLNFVARLALYSVIFLQAGATGMYHHTQVHTTLSNVQIPPVYILVAFFMLTESTL